MEYLLIFILGYTTALIITKLSKDFNEQHDYKAFKKEK